MPDIRELLERESQTVDLEGDHFERLARRRDRKRRNRQIGAAVLAIVVALLSVTGIVRAFSNSERPADEPTPTPVATGLFSKMGGWIAYGDTVGIWAMDPERPETRTRLSTHVGEPLGWSSDGSELLILWQQPVPQFGLVQSRGALSVLHADGTETLVAEVGSPQRVSGSISPDGSTVVYATGSDSDSWIYMVDADGGRPRRLAQGLSSPGLGPEVSWPAFSPDGSQIAYFQGWGDHDNSLWVMNADGSSAHALLKDVGVMKDSAGLRYLGWSPDGRRLAFEMGYGPYRISTVDADGSGLRVIAAGIDPYWSPDGSHISYTAGALGDGPLMMADADGTHVRRLSYLAGSGPWNPLTRAEPATQATSGIMGATGADKLGYAIAALAIIGAVALWRRRKHKAEGPVSNDSMST